MILLPDPAEIATCPPEQLPGLLVRLSALQNLIAARLVAEPATIAPPADVGLLDAADVAALLKIPKAAVYEAARRGQIGSVRASVGSRSGRAVRFTRAQVEAFISSRSHSAAG